MTRQEMVRRVAGWMMVVVAVGFLALSVLSLTIWRNGMPGWDILNAVLLFLCTAMAAVIAHMALRPRATAR